ncbi:MAG: cytochrome c3 family protein [Kofleriaceae bacterium]
MIATRARSDPTAEPAVADEVPFDHTIHAGKYGIPCLDCHVYADKSPVAGIPSGRKCMGCHKFIAADKPAIQKLAERVAAGKPLKWLRVFAVPDFIYFSHRMHVRAKVACAECHGDIAAEKRVVQDRDFTMGRCLACHDERHGPRDCLSCHK